MADLRVAFWNVRNLFEPSSGVERGPRSEDELDAKIAVLARVLSDLFDNGGPDVIGLAEIHTERILNRLVGQLAAPYHMLWERCRSTTHTHTGLAVLARTHLFAPMDRIAAYCGPTAFGRPRYLIARCKLIDRASPILLIVNHWRSKLSVAGTDDARDRLETAQALGEWLAGAPRDTCAIVLGDFNAEPFEEPFSDHGLGSVRHFSPGHRLPHACLYNTAWRFLAEADACETVVRGGAAYTASRPRTTFDAYESSSVIFDQLLVSARALRGGPVALQEGSVSYAVVDKIAYRKDGYMRPRRWSYDRGIAGGASDHFPLVATFRM